MPGNTLFSIGEALIDMIPSRVGCTFDEVPSFSPRTGGAPANVCAAFARLGGASSFLTQLGDDPFGHKIARELEACGIDLSHLVFTDKANTALAFVSLEEDGNRTFSFYRKPSADLLYAPEQIDLAWFRDAFALHFCSVSLVDSPMRHAHLAAIGAALPQLFAGDVQLVLYTCGSKGAYAYTRAAHAFAPCQKVRAVDTTGAGDGFIGSFLWQLSRDGVTVDKLEKLSCKKLKEYLDFSNRFCGLSVQKHGAIDSYPTLPEMGL